MRQVSWALGLFALLLIGAMARADESNFRPYVVGGRAAGMGGAFTALADDGSGPYYNPGGLAFADRSMLSLSASVYGIVRGSQEDGLGDGHDFGYSSLNVFPVSTSSITKFGTADTSGGAPNAVALSVFVPDAKLIDARDTLGSSGNAVLVGGQVQTIWAGVTYGRRLNRLGIGAGAFVLVGTEKTLVDFRRGNETAFLTVTGRSEQTIVGAVGAVGLRYDISDKLRIGASLYSPELGMVGSREKFVRAETNDRSEVVSRDDLHATPSLPWRAQAGIAWTSGQLTLAADAIVLGARETHDDVALASQGLDRRVKRNMVVNGAAGLEYVMGDRFPVRAGIFTDFAASEAPTPSSTWDNNSHLDRYGGTASIGYRTDHTSTDLGLNVSYASGQSLRPNDLSFQEMVVTGSTETLFYLFLATSYQF
jgi:long-chain fatty acid transport protein